MKMNKWPKLFNNKNFLYTKNSLNIYNSGDFITRSFKLSKIINHNLNFKKYIQLTNFIKKITFIKKEDSLLDFGSGNGAFLYFFINKLKLKKNVSFEISMPLLEVQKKFIKKTFFTNNIKSIKKNSVDHSISYSVFQYFKSNNHAKNILNNLIRVTKKNVVLFDIKNNKLKNKFKLNQRIKQGLTEIDYQKKYRNLPYRFYSKKFFIDFVKNKRTKLKINFYNMPKVSLDYKFGYCVKISKI
jgi:ubiquinone/menaquinone biosynthesis C-methylase UbiE